ncbi:hypothetical protein KR222_011605 [Zaprionus bogoriensis]|nr:hypothetical protein KR222_011605 [Zaprionus bogoriensis]
MNSLLPLLLLLLLQLTLVLCQQLPENPCSLYFQYVRSSAGGYQGELTLPLQNGRNRIDVRFSQRGPQDVTVVGALQPYPDEATVRANSAAGKFRVNLWPAATGLLPKLSRLAFNGATLCTASDYAPPSSYFNRFYVMQINANAPRRLSPNPAVFNTFPAGQTSDVEFRTLYLNTPVGQQLPQDAIPNLVADWFKEQSSSSAAALPQPGTTVAVTPAWPTPATATTAVSVPAPWPTPALQVNRLNPISTSAFFVCGQEGTSSPFIQRGQEFPRGMYPWLSAIYHKESFSLAFKCGGSLVSASLVITAAHCVYKIKEDRVVVALGRYDLDNYNEDGAEVRNVIRITTHPEYSSRLQQQPDADIALITVDQPVIFNDLIRPICLWEAAAEDIESEVGNIAGWGTDEQGNSMTRYPHVVEAKVASEAECARKWKVQRVLERTLCAGNLDGSGPCLGDSGGGLMIKRNNRWLLRGIVSLGERTSVGHCNLNQYVLYCDLSKHLTWLRQNLS